MVSQKTAGCNSSVQEMALRYHGIGLSIVPIISQGKHSPKGFRWKPYVEHRPRRRQIEGWFSKPFDIAMVHGPASGNVGCRDLDSIVAYDVWREHHPELARVLPTHRTERGFHVYFRTDGLDSALSGIKCFAQLGDGEIRLRGCHSRLPTSDDWIVPPWDGFPMVRSVVPAGLVPDDFEIAFSGARARGFDTCHYMPLQRQGIDLFRSDGSLDREACDRFIEPTLPTAKGQRESCLWLLVRLLKTLPSIRGLPVDELDPIIRRWHQLALSTIGTKDYVMSYASFVRAWERAAVPVGTSPTMHDVRERARRGDFPKVVCDKFGQSHPICLAAAICRELAILGGGQFFLDVRTLGRLIDVSHEQAAAFLRSLVGMRFIKRLSNPRRGRACEYAYLHPLPAPDVSPESAGRKGVC